MKRYYSSCAAGLETAASALAARAIRGYAPEMLMSGALLYTAQEDRPHMDVFQNTYAVLATYSGGLSPERAAAKAAMDPSALGKADDMMKRYGFATFRVMFSERNQLVSVNAQVRDSIERRIRSARPDRLSPQTELLFLRRSEGITLFLLRLTKRKGTEKTLRQGELSPGIAACMAELCRPRKDGVFWDPFAGTGAIGAARARLCPAKAICVSDIDPAMISLMKAKKTLAGATVFQADALAPVDSITDGSVTELATDPPWGAFAPLPEPAETFYPKLLRQCARALATGGRLCLLTADKAAFEAAAETCAQQLRFDKRTDVLVNGKKAAIYTAERI